MSALSPLSRLKRKLDFGAVRSVFDPTSDIRRRFYAAIARVVSVPLGRPIWGGYDGLLQGAREYSKLHVGCAAT